MEIPIAINWSAVDEIISKACDQLKSSNLKKVNEALMELKAIFHRMLSNTDRRQLADKLGELRFVELAKTVFVNLDTQNQASQGLADEIEFRVLDMLMSLTNHSSVISQLVVENDIHVIIARLLKKNATSHGLQSLFGGNPRKQNVTTTCLCVLMNMMRLHPDSRQHLQSTVIQDVLVKLKRSEGPYQKIFAIMTLCLLIESAANNSDVLKVEKSDVELFLKGVLMKAMTETARGSMIAQIVPGLGEKITEISADETLQCLSILAKNRDNALEMIKQGVISQCEGYLEFVVGHSALGHSEVSPHSVNNAVKWALSLLRRLKSTVPECSFLFTFQDVLTKLRDHPNDDISQFASDLIAN